MATITVGEGEGQTVGERGNRGQSSARLGEEPGATVSDRPFQREQTLSESKDPMEPSQTHPENREMSALSIASAQRNDISHQQIIEQVFRQVCGTDGVIDKAMLPPALCRAETMKLWSTTLQANNFDHITRISLRWCAIQSIGARALAEGIVNTCVRHLTHLDLMGNEIGVSGSRAISSIIAPGVDLDKYQHTGDKAGFSESPSGLRVLIMSYNGIADGGCTYFGKAIALSSSIETLQVENCDIGDNGIKYLRRGIERNSTLKTLNIASNRFGDQGSKDIQTLLLRNHTLEYLDISRNRLGANRTTDIAKGLTVNRSLRVLRMNINRIGARGAQNLAKMLVNNAYLQELELSYNEMFNDGVQVLSQGISQNHGLRRLVLWYNGLEDSAARHLAKALVQRASQQYFRGSMAQAIADANEDFFYSWDPETGEREPLDELFICEFIVEFLPIYMHFEIDLSHNRRISKAGISALLDLAESPRVEIEGLKESLGRDRRDREADGDQMSLY